MASTPAINAPLTNDAGFTARSFFAWAAKNFLLPLTPFFTGAIIRTVAGIEGPKNIFDVGELCFSMAMLCLLVVASSGRVSDQHLRESLVGMWIMGGVMFLSLFVIAIFVKTQIDFSLQEFLVNVHKTVSNAAPSASFPALDPGVQRYGKVLERIWVLAVIAAIPVTIFAGTCKFLFKLED
jgi:hypothetical protein